MNEKPKWTEGDWIFDVTLDCVFTDTPMVGNVICHGPDRTCESYQNWEAHGHLLAASKKLYEALNNLLIIQETDRIVDMYYVVAVRDQARKALKQARGEKAQFIQEEKE